MLVQRRKQWPGIEITLGQRLVFAGKGLSAFAYNSMIWPVNKFQSNKYFSCRVNYSTRISCSIDVLRYIDKAESQNVSLGRNKQCILWDLTRCKVYMSTIAWSRLLKMATLVAIKIWRFLIPLAMKGCIQSEIELTLTIGCDKILRHI